jgi:hypothetical protein
MIDVTFADPENHLGPPPTWRCRLLRPITLEASTPRRTWLL